MLGKSQHALEVWTPTLISVAPITHASCKCMWPSVVVGILGNKKAVHNRGVGHLSVAMAETSPEISLQLQLEIVGPIGDSPLTLCPSLKHLCLFGEHFRFLLAWEGG